jgi:paraquat-inducible protein B
VATGNVNQLVLGADRLVNDTNGEMKTISEGIQNAVSDTKNLLKSASREIHAVSADARKLLKDTDGQIQPVGKKAQEALVSARRALDQAKNTLAGVNGFVGERSDTQHKLNASLDEIGAAAQSLHSLMDYLERHPEALLKGKGGRGG